MNAMEKVGWTELLVSVVAVAVATLLYPWLGERATSAFALLALVMVSVVFLRQRGTRIVIDERDREIERRATSIGVGTAWMALFTALAVAATWSSYTNAHAVSTGFLNWLIWVQFAMYFGIKGLATIALYRRRQHAA
jgi:cytochrome bd-type quinol oxidase subunit 2